MGVIKVLPDSIKSKIAAGEVIERPASVVKELIENAIDAGATYIKIEVEHGGKKSIKVYDNGSGILYDDMHLLFMSHATSKLYEEDELFSIMTLGFRGEALFSIGSVCQCQIESRPQHQEIGGHVSVEGGLISSVKPVNCPKGTTVEVRNLFYNLPARRKFLRGDDTEFMHIHSTVTRYAIAYPQIEFYLSHNAIPQVELRPSKTTKERIAQFFGQEFADELIHKQIEDDPFYIDAYLALPQYSRTTTDGQFFFVNNRYVKDKVIARNINLAYRELIPYGRYPCAFIFVYTPEKEVDINVHPTKIEVKFKNSYKLAQIIEQRLREALLDACVSPSIKLEQFETGKSLYEEVVDFFTKPAQEITTTQSQQLKVFAEEKRYFHIKGLYIILEEEDGIRIIDQHALHERYIYEQLKKQFAVSDVKRQRLLMPKIVELTKEEFLMLEDNKPLVNSTGIEYEIFGPATIAVHTMPTLLQNEDTGSVIRNFISLIKEKKDTLSLVDEILQFMACKFAIKSGKTLAQEEIKRLIESCSELKNPQTCVHGRPISVKITFRELEKLFHKR